MDTDSNVKVTWSSHLFDVIKIRKRINILPLKVRICSGAILWQAPRRGMAPHRPPAHQELQRPRSAGGVGHGLEPRHQRVLSLCERQGALS